MNPTKLLMATMTRKRFRSLCLLSVYCLLVALCSLLLFLAPNSDLSLNNSNKNNDISNKNNNNNNINNGNNDNNGNNSSPTNRRRLNDIADVHSNSNNNKHKHHHRHNSNNKENKDNDNKVQPHVSTTLTPPQSAPREGAKSPTDDSFQSCSTPAHTGSEQAPSHFRKGKHSNDKQAPFRNVAPRRISDNSSSDFRDFRSAKRVDAVNSNSNNVNSNNVNSNNVNSNNANSNNSRSNANVPQQPQHHQQNRHHQQNKHQQPQQQQQQTTAPPPPPPPKKRLVPRTAHIVWFYPNSTAFRFHQALSLLSVQKFFRPSKIFFWHDTLPSGTWWMFARQSVAHLLLVPLERPRRIFNWSVSVPEHQSDVARIQLLKRYGGLYVDLDVILLRDLGPLLGHEVTMGAETPDILGSGFILARPEAAFLGLWLDSYRNDFDDGDWNGHSTKVPMELARAHPELVHVEWFAINRPNWFERRWLYEEGRLWDWSGNYAVHLWYREHNVDYSPLSIRRLNSTVAEIFRFIYYQSPKLLDD